MSAERISVVVPMFNEARGVTAFLAALLPALEATGYDYEVVAVDDGSADDTVAVLKAAHAANARIKVVALSRNFGKEIAVAAGLRHASGDAAIVMDSDLQHPPHVIAQFIAKWREGYDVVYGQRLDRSTDSPLRRFLALRYYRTFELLSGNELHPNAGDFRLLSRRAIDAMNKLGERARFNKGLFAWIGFKSVGVPFDMPQRFDQTPSRWRLRRLWHFALDGLASFTTAPLRIWSYIGVAVSLVALVFGIVIIVKTLLFGDAVAGYPTLMVSILFLGGVQLISLGVIGEYLGRVYEEVKARPLYLLSETVGTAPADAGTRAATDTPRRPAEPTAPGGRPA